MHKTDKQACRLYLPSVSITLNGEKRWAKDYGLKAWRIPLHR
jgi:hypothetical protein